MGLLKDLTSNGQGEQVAGGVGQEDHSKTRAQVRETDNVGSDRGNKGEERAREEAVHDREANQSTLSLGKHPDEARKTSESKGAGGNTDGSQTITSYTDDNTTDSVGTRHDRQQLATLDVGVQSDNILGERGDVGEGDDVGETKEGGGDKPEHETGIAEDGQVDGILALRHGGARELTGSAHNQGSKGGADKVEDGVDAEGPVDSDSVDQGRDDETEGKTTNTSAGEADTHGKTTVLVIPERRNSGGGQVEEGSADTEHDTLGKVQLPELTAPGGEQETEGTNDASGPEDDLVTESVHNGAGDDTETKLEPDGKGTDKGDGGRGRTASSVDIVVVGLEDTVDGDISDSSQDGLFGEKEMEHIVS